jgi:hypothetical protein
MKSDFEATYKFIRKETYEQLPISAGMSQGNMYLPFIPAFKLPS